MTDVRYAVSYVRTMLCALGFSKRIPDPVHVNASTNQQCTRWYEETIHLISRLERRGFTVITQDESFVNDVIRGYEYSFIVHEGDTVIIQVNNDIIHRDITRKKADGKIYPKKWLNDVHPS